MGYASTLENDNERRQNAKSPEPLTGRRTKYPFDPPTPPGRAYVDGWLWDEARGDWSKTRELVFSSNYCPSEGSAETEGAVSTA